MPLPGWIDAFVVAGDPAVGNHAVVEAHPELPGKVAVTGSRCPQCVGAGVFTQ